MANGATDYSNNPVYTRFLTTSYKGQLLEITFTTNLTTDPKLKAEIENHGFDPTFTPRSLRNRVSN